MLIDGQLVTIDEAQYESARQQLGLPAGYKLVEATGLLVHQTGNGQVQIPLPTGYVVGAFEDVRGYRQYGVVQLEGFEGFKK
ncbi:hypothetical protein [Pseudomonas fluorescens]|uniref:hypothetical protein n=1 Tax=Pseudomonas fluorescens TaxID=294 RepID=UPI002781637C|nr:hypothetical protein [Pseudomonas fluorescens]MDP9783487.1 hypothetical protein [Pseudomonas fluorescens]